MSPPTVPIIVCRGDEYHSAVEVFTRMSTDSLSEVEIQVADDAYFDKRNQQGGWT